MGEDQPLLGENDRIGAYRILDTLGRGGMGEVFLAWDDRLRRKVAIKRIRRDHSLNTTLRQRLVREARAVAGLCHPAIVQVFDLIEDPAGDCLVLEYVEGRTLAAALREGPLAPPAALRLGREIAEGLATAHGAGIVHRDLKAENVIVTPAGHAKILDFGLALMRSRATDDYLVTEHGVLLGTFHMMSPEQAKGDEADGRSDLFSLGILLYEMVTGISPFRASNPMATLNRVISEHPPRVDAVRPGLPLPLGSLIERLLAKDRDARPAGAAKVAEDLAAIEATLSSSRLPVVETESVSDQPTIVEFRPNGVTPAFPRSSEAPAASTMGMSALSKRRFVREIAVAAVLAVLAAGGYFLFYRHPESRKPAAEQPAKPVQAKILRVVVPRPQIEGDDERLSLAASGVLTTCLSTLGELQGVAPVDPLQIVGASKSAADMARAAAADEILITTLEKSGSLARITLRRVQGSDGRVLWTEVLDASFEAQDLRLLAEAVGSRLRRGFPEHPPRPGSLPLDVSKEEYAAFLKIKERMDSGLSPVEPELAQLERIAERSPRFLEARTLGADVALSRFKDTRADGYRDRARALLREAEALAPNDPRTLRKRFKLELAFDPPAAAAATLARIESLQPEDPQILPLRSSLAEKEGRPEEAIVHLRKAAELLPSWQNLYRLASLEARHGRMVDARHHLHQILAGSPGNLWALQRLAEIELEFGDVGRAKVIYQDLFNRSPQRTYLTNLGVAEVLLFQYEEAVAIFRKALEMTPNHLVTTLNMADAELALGRTPEARAHYSQVLQALKKERLANGLSPSDSMMEAQCLARLGRTGEAVELTLNTLQVNPTDSDLLQSAALVYTLVGDWSSARLQMKRALERGVQPRWFTMPAYAPLFKDPEFQRLIQRKR
ncbi:MAG: protein kinase domain-containing protein [Thermoanaerobaculia bacterium]